MQILFKNRGIQYFERFSSLEAVFDVTLSYIVRESEEIKKLGRSSSSQFPFHAAQANKFIGNTANARASAKFALSDSSELHCVYNAEVERFISSLD